MSKLPLPDDIFSVLEQVYKLRKEWGAGLFDKSLLAFLGNKPASLRRDYRTNAQNIRSAIRDLRFILEDLEKLEKLDQYERESTSPDNHF